MARWADIERAEPEFAKRVQALFDAGRHKTIATIRKDGSPRISGIECEFVDGEVRFGSMDNARKLADLQRDPRVGLHGPTFHPVEGQEKDWPGEAKIHGTAHGAGEAWTIDIREVAITHLNEEATRLVVEWWTPDGGHQQIERD